MLIKLVVIRATPKNSGAMIAKQIEEIEEKIAKSTTRQNRAQMEETQLREIYETVNADGNISRMGFQLDGYRYDSKNDRIILYSPFEYRLYIPSSPEKYSRFIQELEYAEAHNIAYNCKMLAYYSDPDVYTGRTTIPVVGLLFRWLFN